MSMLTQLRDQTARLATVDGGLAERHHVVAAATLLDQTATRALWEELGFDFDRIRQAVSLHALRKPGPPALDLAAILAPVEGLFARATDPAVQRNRSLPQVLAELACAAQQERKTLRRWGRRLLRRAAQKRTRRPAQQKADTIPADWLESPALWFPPHARPRPAAERVENGPFGNDQLATPTDLEPFLNDPGDGQHLPLFGVTLILENEETEFDEGRP